MIAEISLAQMVIMRKSGGTEAIMKNTVHASLVVLGLTGMVSLEQMRASSSRFITSALNVQAVVKETSVEEDPMTGELSAGLMIAGAVSLGYLTASGLALRPRLFNCRRKSGTLSTEVALGVVHASLTPMCYGRL